MSAVESPEDLRTLAFAKRSRWRPTPWIAAVGHRLYLQLCAAHGWATSLHLMEGSLYHLAASAISPLLVLARSAVARAIKK
jgi:hypothetical protein